MCLAIREKPILLFNFDKSNYLQESELMRKNIDKILKKLRKNETKIKQNNKNW